MSRFNAYTSAFLAMGLIGAGSASAATIVTDWDYNLTGIWSAFAPGSVNISVDQKTLSWGALGANTNESSLVITDPANPSSVSTFMNGGMPPAAFIADGITLTHNNVVIQGDSLDNATLTATLILTPTNPASGALPPASIDYLIEFEETANSGTCADPSSPTPCNDIFVQVTGFLNQSFMYDAGDGEVEYFVNIFPTDGNVLATLNDASCIAAGAAPGCIGFTTPEGQSTDLPFGFTISTKPISEPATLALMGLGLLGAARLRRRS